MFSIVSLSPEGDWSSFTDFPLLQASVDHLFFCLPHCPRPSWPAVYFLPCPQSHVCPLLLGGRGGHGPAQRVHRLLQVSAGHCRVQVLAWILSQQLPRVVCRGKGPWKPCTVDAVHKRCDIHQPAFWQTFHTLSVKETNGLGSLTTTLRFRLHELRKSLLPHPDVPRSFDHMLMWTSWRMSKQTVVIGEGGASKGAFFLVFQ